MEKAVKLHFCGICKTTPDQMSHHKAHLKTQKHIFKKKCFEQCVNMTILHIHNTNTDDLIKTFESETSVSYDENVDVFRSWRFDLMTNLNKLIEEEYPNAIIPEYIPRANFKSDQECIQNWFDRIMQSNETITIKAKVPEIIKNIQTEQYQTFKERIKNSDIHEFIINAIQSNSEYDLSVILYKLNMNKYSCKDYRSNIWINKLDSTIPSNEVLVDIRNQLTTNVSDIFVDYLDKLVDTDKCLKIIHILKRTNVKNNIIKEAKELFYNN